MAEVRLLGPPVTGEDEFEGEYYNTPAMARRAIDTHPFGFLAIPFVSFVQRRRFREEKKEALASVPLDYESFRSYKFTGQTGKARIYLSRKVANEQQPAIVEIGKILKPATREGTYRFLGAGGLHVTVASLHVDMEGMRPHDFIECTRARLAEHAGDRLRPVGKVAVIGTQILGSKRGGPGSSRFIGLTPHPEAGLLEEMRGVKRLYNPLVDAKNDRDWFNTPHISVARADAALFTLPLSEQTRLEATLRADIEEQTEQMRALTLTSWCVDITDA